MPATPHSAQGTSGFIQLVPTRLDQAVPGLDARRTGRRFDARSMTIDLLGSSDWRSGHCEPFGIVAWCEDRHLTWRRGRRALAHLEANQVAEAHLQPFHLGSVRVHRPRVVHERTAPESFVQFSPSAHRGLIAEHALSWEAAGILSELVLRVDGERRLATTLVRLSADLDLGRISLRRGLDDLAGAGLVTYCPVRGVGTSITVPAWDHLVVPPGPVPKRHERRAQSRDHDAAGSVCTRLAEHFGIEPGQLLASTALRSAIGTAMEAGLRPAQLTEAIVAGGNLANLQDPVAGLVARSRRAAEALLAARQAEDDRRRAQAAQRDAQRRAAQDEAVETEEAAAQSRWLAGVLDDDALGRLASLYSQAGPLQLPTVAVAAQVLAHAGRAVASASHLDPLSAIQANLDRRLDQGPIGVLPRAGPGLSLLERLRALG